MIFNSSILTNAFGQSSEILNYYACLLAIMRFTDGVSWGYSDMLQHEDLEYDNKLAIKVIFNILLKVKKTLCNHPEVVKNMHEIDLN
jgi:hypothetical protein